MTLLELARRLTCPHRDRLIASLADGLAAEREVARLRRSLDMTAQHFHLAQRRADAMEEARDRLTVDNAALRAELEQATADRTEAIDRAEYLEQELKDTLRAYQALKDAAPSAAKKGRR